MSEIRGTTRLLGLIGDPVSHSLSPAMHNAALAELGLDYVYLPFAVRPQDLGTAVAGLAALGGCGFNVTIPHKQAILSHLQVVDPRAEAVGAVNTVYQLEPGGWGGTNTDVLGFVSPLRALAAPRVATILGCGGSARAVIAGCLELGIPTVRVVGRAPEPLAQLRELWPQIETYAWSARQELLPQTELLVNTTPIGMEGKSPGSSPLTAAELSSLPAAAIVYDLIYTPRPSALLRDAATLGYVAIDGLEMLIAQGAAALSLWLGGSEVPVEAMRRAALSQLGSDPAIRLKR